MGDSWSGSPYRLSRSAIGPARPDCRYGAQMGSLIAADAARMARRGIGVKPRQPAARGNSRGWRNSIPVSPAFGPGRSRRRPAHRGSPAPRTAPPAGIVQFGIARTSAGQPARSRTAPAPVSAPPALNPPARPRCTRRARMAVTGRPCLIDGPGRQPAGLEPRLPRRASRPPARMTASTGRPRTTGRRSPENTVVPNDVIPERPLKTPARIVHSPRSWHRRGPGPVASAETGRLTPASIGRSFHSVGISIRLASGRIVQ